MASRITVPVRHILVVLDLRARRRGMNHATLPYPETAQHDPGAPRCPYHRQDDGGLTAADRIGRLQH